MGSISIGSKEVSLEFTFSKYIEPEIFPYLSVPYRLRSFLSKIGFVFIPLIYSEFGLVLGVIIAIHSLSDIFF